MPSRFALRRLSPSEKAVFNNEASSTKNKYGVDVDAYSDVSLSSDMAARPGWSADVSKRSARKSYKDNPFARSEEDMDMTAINTTFRRSLKRFGAERPKKSGAVPTKLALEEREKHRKKKAARKVALFKNKRRQLDSAEKAKKAAGMRSLLGGDWKGMGSDDDNDDWGDDNHRKTPIKKPIDPAIRELLRDPPPVPPASAGAVGEFGSVVSPVRPLAEGYLSDGCSSSTPTFRSSASSSQSSIRIKKKPPPPSLPPPSAAVLSSTARRRSLLKERGRRGSNRLSITSLIGMDMGADAGGEDDEEEPEDVDM